MATDVVMPQMGESIAEGTITKWLVKEGDTVERDQPLFEISTDKVDAEIPSPAAGTLLEIKHEEGATVAVDDIVAVIGEEGESTGESTEKKAPAPEKVDETAEGGAYAADAPAGEGADDGEESSSGTASEDDRLRQFSSPVVRKIAEEEDVDISQVTGTGAQGRVTKKDIMAFIEQRSEGGAPAPAETKEAPARAAAPAQAAAPSAPAPKPPAAAQPSTGYSVAPYLESDDVQIEPMSKIREITAAHMVYSKQTSAHVTTVFEMDMTNVVRIREKAKRRFQDATGTKLTYMPFFFRATIGALKAYPMVNASIDGTNIVYKKNINLGIAVAMERGLIVPVIKNADQLSMEGLAKSANDLADRARNKKIKPDEIQGGTFTITNPGGFGTLFGTPVINQPQVGILGIGALEKRPVVVQDSDGNDAIAIRSMCYVTLTYDHRLVDGAEGSYFLREVQKVLESNNWPELEAYL